MARSHAKKKEVKRATERRIREREVEAGNGIDPPPPTTTTRAAAGAAADGTTTTTTTVTKQLLQD